MAYVYILQDRISGRYYIGSCLEISTRVARHQRHTGGQTTKNGDWRLVCYRACQSMAEARQQEKLVKSYKGGNAFKKIVTDERDSGKVAEWLQALHPAQGGASGSRGGG